MNYNFNLFPKLLIFILALFTFQIKCMEEPERKKEHDELESSDEFNRLWPEDYLFFEDKETQKEVSKEDLYPRDLSCISFKNDIPYEILFKIANELDIYDPAFSFISPFLKNKPKTYDQLLLEIEQLERSFLNIFLDMLTSSNDWEDFINRLNEQEKNLDKNCPNFNELEEAIQKIKGNIENLDNEIKQLIFKGENDLTSPELFPRFNFFVLNFFNNLKFADDEGKEQKLIILKKKLLIIKLLRNKICFKKLFANSPKATFNVCKFWFLAFHSVLNSKLITSLWVMPYLSFPFIFAYKLISQKLTKRDFFALGAYPALFVVFNIFHTLTKTEMLLYLKKMLNNKEKEILDDLQKLEDIS